MTIFNERTKLAMILNVKQAVIFVDGGVSPRYSILIDDDVVSLQTTNLSSLKYQILLCFGLECDLESWFHFVPWLLVDLNFL